MFRRLHPRWGDSASCVQPGSQMLLPASVALRDYEGLQKSISRGDEAAAASDLAPGLETSDPRC